MAYATLAGVSPINGIYVTLFAPFIYAIFGTSSQLHVSSIAITSIMSADAIRQNLHKCDTYPNDPKEYSITFLSLSAVIAFQVGIIQFLLGILNGGVIANLLSHSVIVGFMSAAALIIGMHLFYIIIHIYALFFFCYVVLCNKNIKQCLRLKVY